MMNEDKPQHAGNWPDKTVNIQKGVTQHPDRLSLPDFEYTPKTPPTNPPAPQTQDANQENGTSDKS